MNAPIQPRMTGSLSTSFQSMPTWAKWLLGVLVVGGLGAIAWAFLHKPSSREHRRQARSAEQASRRARQRAKKHHAAAKRARREEKRRK